MQDMSNVELDTSAIRQAPNGREASGMVIDPDLTRQVLDQMDAVNLDEVTTGTIRVAVREESEEIVTHNGENYARKKFSTRIAEISDYVPNDILNEMLLGRVNKIKECRNKGLDSDQTQAELTKWAIEPVWQVWKLTEPWVKTPHQLSRMLDSVKVQALFVRFFGAQLRLLKK